MDSVGHTKDRSRTCIKCWKRVRRCVMRCGAPGAITRAVRGMALRQKTARRFTGRRSVTAQVHLAFSKSIQFTTTWMSRPPTQTGSRPLGRSRSDRTVCRLTDCLSHSHLPPNGRVSSVNHESPHRVSPNPSPVHSAPPWRIRSANDGSTDDLQAPCFRGFRAAWFSDIAERARVHYGEADPGVRHRHDAPREKDRPCLTSRASSPPPRD